MIAQLQALLASLATSFDLPILDWIRATLSSPLMDKIMVYTTYCGEPVTVIVFALVLLLFRKTRKTAWSTGLAMVLGLLVCNILLKPMVARIRPYDLHAQLTGETIKLLVKTPHDFSFPSGHAIALFEMSTVMAIRHKSFAIPAFILAIAVSFSRLYLYVHYPSDVLFSVVAGILFGLLGAAIVSLIYKLHPPKRGKYETAAQ